MHMFNKFKEHLYFLIKKKTKDQKRLEDHLGSVRVKNYSGKTITAKCQEVNLHKLKMYL